MPLPQSFLVGLILACVGLLGLMLRQNQQDVHPDRVHQRQRQLWPPLLMLLLFVLPALPPPSLTGQVWLGLQPVFWLALAVIPVVVFLHLLQESRCGRRPGYVAFYLGNLLTITWLVAGLGLAFAFRLIHPPDVVPHLTLCLLGIVVGLFQLAPFILLAHQRIHQKTILR